MIPSNNFFLGIYFLEHLIFVFEIVMVNVPNFGVTCVFIEWNLKGIIEIFKLIICNICYSTIS